MIPIKCRGFCSCLNSILLYQFPLADIFSNFVWLEQTNVVCTLQIFTDSSFFRQPPELLFALFCVSRCIIVEGRYFDGNDGESLPILSFIFKRLLFPSLFIFLHVAGHSQGSTLYSTLTSLIPYSEWHLTTCGTYLLPQKWRRRRRTCFLAQKRRGDIKSNNQYSSGNSQTSSNRHSRTMEAAQATGRLLRCLTMCGKHTLTSHTPSNRVTNIAVPKCHHNTTTNHVTGQTRQVRKTLQEC